MVHSYLTDDDHIEKKAKDTKKCVIRQETKLHDYKEFLENCKTMLRSKQSFRSEAYNIFTDKLIDISLSTNAEKRIKTSDGVTPYLYGYGCYAESSEYRNIEYNTKKLNIIINFDKVIGENTQENKLQWSQIAGNHL